MRRIFRSADVNGFMPFVDKTFSLSLIFENKDITRAQRRLLDKENNEDRAWNRKSSLTEILSHAMWKQWVWESWKQQKDD